MPVLDDIQESRGNRYVDGFRRKIPNVDSNTTIVD